MKQSELIEAVLHADPEKHAAIMAAIRGAGRARPITTKAAAALIGAHPKTVLRYAREGKLTPVRFSKRMIRFDEREVLRLLEGGAA